MKNFRLVLSLLLQTFLMASLILGPVTAPIANAKSKFKPDFSKVDKDGRNGWTLTFDQVAKLSPGKRIAYIRMMRETALEIEILQQKLKGQRKLSAANEYQQKHDLIDESAKFLFGEYAHAQTESWENACLAAGYKSSYPEDKGGDFGRVYGQCQMIPCGPASVKGVEANPVYSGFPEGSRESCFATSPSATNYINKVYASWEVWKRREKLLGRIMLVEDPTGTFRRVTDPEEQTQLYMKKYNKTREQTLAIQKETDSYVDNSISKATEFFGFESGKFSKDLFNSPQAADHIAALKKAGYHDRAYGYLWKLGEFYKKNNEKFPGETDVPGAKADSYNQNLEVSYNALRAHCGFIPGTDGKVKTLRKVEIDDIRNGVAIKYPEFREHVKKGGTLDDFAKKDDLTSFDRLEYERIEHLRNLPAGVAPTWGNVMEKRECNLIQISYENRLKERENIAITYPDVITGEPPIDLPKPPVVAPIDKVNDPESTGCTENTTREESKLVHPVARCMVCAIQAHEAKKGKKKNDMYAGTYTPSRKYISLMSTMALACGYGTLGGASLPPDAMMKFWAAAGHCKAQLYNWRGNENEALVEKWNKKQDFWWGLQNRKDTKKKFNPKKNKADPMSDDAHPDTNDEFTKVYGLKYTTAKSLFCDPDRFDKDGAFKPRSEWPVRTPSEELKVLRARINQAKELVGNKDNPAAFNLKECLNEAVDNANEMYRGSNVCYAVKSANGYTPSYFNNDGGPDKFLSDPPILFSGNNCFIPKQKDHYKYTMKDGKEALCPDLDGDNKNDKDSSVTCEGKAYSYVWVAPDMVENSSEEYIEYKSKEGMKGTMGHFIAYKNGSPSQLSGLEMSVPSDDGCNIGQNEVKVQKVKGGKKTR